MHFQIGSVPPPVTGPNAVPLFISFTPTPDFDAVGKLRGPGDSTINSNGSADTDRRLAGTPLLHMQEIVMKAAPGKSCEQCISYACKKMEEMKTPLVLQAAHS